MNVKLAVAAIALLLTGGLGATPTLFFAGDSTLDDYGESHGGKPRPPYASWGTVLQTLMKDGCKVSNFARCGRSTKSFRAEGYWQRLLAEVKAGDFVVIQFGHNDQKHATEEQRRELFAPPDGLYRENLRAFAADVRAKGATPVFCTPIVRATFDETGKKLVDTTWSGDGVTLGSYAQATRETGRELGVDVVDMNALTGALCEKLGKDEAHKFYVISTGLVKGKDGEPAKDVTHPIRRGAEAYARLFYEDVRARGLKVSSLMAGSDRPDGSSFTHRFERNGVLVR